MAAKIKMNYFSYIERKRIENKNPGFDTEILIFHKLVASNSFLRESYKEL